MTQKHDLVWLTAKELTAGLRARDLSPLDVLESCLQRVDDLDDQVKAMVHVAIESARGGAKASQKRWQAGEPLGPLDGVSVAVKDFVPVAGMPLRYGSRTSSEMPVDEYVPSVSHLLDSGAVLIGKTNTAKHGWKAVCWSDLSDITRNPWNTERSPGDSSGGSAVAVASGMAPLALGGDEDGSIRVPSSFCGITRLKQGPAAPARALRNLEPRRTHGAYDRGCGSGHECSRQARCAGLGKLARHRTRLSRQSCRRGHRPAGRAQPRPGLRKLGRSSTASGAPCRGAVSNLGAYVTEATPQVENPIEPYYVLIRLAVRSIVDSISRRPVSLA